MPVSIPRCVVMASRLPQLVPISQSCAGILVPFGSSHPAPYPKLLQPMSFPSPSFSFLCHPHHAPSWFSLTFWLLALYWSTCPPLSLAPLSWSPSLAPPALLSSSLCWPYSVQYFLSLSGLLQIPQPYLGAARSGPHFIWYQIVADHCQHCWHC